MAKTNAPQDQQHSTSLAHIQQEVDSLVSSLMEKFSIPEEDIAPLRQRMVSEMMQNRAKDVMIDVAEETFKIPIRKKAGAKR